MFDIGFQELILVAVVALVVVGPERLPHLARVAGKWVGRARRTLISVQQEIERELKAEELKRILDEQAKRRPLETLLEEAAFGAGDPLTRTPAPQQPSAVQPPAAKDKELGASANTPDQTPRP